MRLQLSPRGLVLIAIAGTLIASRGFAQADKSDDAAATEAAATEAAATEAAATEAAATESARGAEAKAEKLAPPKNDANGKDAGRLTKKEAAPSPTAPSPTAEKPDTPGPAKSDSAKTEPMKADSGKADPVKSDPSRNAPTQVTSGKGKAARDPNEKIRLSVADVGWERVIRDFADRWGFALYNSSSVPGSFTYSDPRPLDRKQQMDVLNSALLTKGFVLARREQILLLHNLKDGPVPDPWVPYARREDVGELGEFELRKMIFAVDRADFDVVTTEVKNVVEPPPVDGSSAVKLPGRLIPLPASKQLFVVETGGNLRAIDALVRGISGDGVKSFKVAHITLDEALVVIKPLLGIAADLDHSTDNSIKLAPYASTNSLLVTAKPDVIKQVESILKLIDVEDKTPPTAPVARPQLKIYAVAGDSQTIERILQTMLVGNLGVRLTRDPSNGNIVALATPDQHAIIASTIETMEGKGLKKFRSWQLAGNADPTMVLATITELLGAGGQTSTPGTGADAKTKVAPVMSGGPKIIINTNNRSLLAFGTETQLKQIDELLGVQKWSDLRGKEPGGVMGSTVRLLPFHRDAVDLIKQHFPSMRKNPIEVVVPSRGNRTDSIESSPGREKQSMHKTTPLRNLPTRGSDGEKGESKKPTTQERGPERTTARSVRQAAFASFVAQRVQSSDLAIGQPTAHRATSELQPPRITNPGAAMKPRDLRPAPNADADAELRTGSVTGGGPRYASATVGKPGNASRENVGQEIASEENVAQASDPSESTTKRESAKPGQLPGSKDKPVKITVTDKGIVISSEDPAALDAIEELLGLLPADPLSTGNFRIYYLKHLSASTAKAELDQILTGDTTESGGATASGNLVGDVARSLGGGLMGSMVEGMLGSGSAGGVGSLVSGSALIVPDDRLNALIVQASPAEQSLIEQVLYYIDAEDGPDTKVARKPGMIPVFSTNAEEIAATVKELYSDRMITGRGQGGQQPSPQEFIAALRGGGGRKQQNQRRAEDADKMTIGVDKRSNSLIVVAPQPLFDEVSHLVQVLDYASAEEANDVRRVVSINGMSAEALARALKAVAGDKVQTMTTGPAMGGPSTGPAGPGTAPGAPPGAAPSGAPADGGNPQERIQRFLQMQQLFGGQGGGRGPGGGGAFGSGGGGSFGPGGGGRKGGGR